MKRLFITVVSSLALTFCMAASLESGVIGAQEAPLASSAPVMTRLTGADNTPACNRWRVCGADLGIPYLLANGSVGYVFGDTFDVARPEQSQLAGWRSPVILRSASQPWYEPITFDNAAGVRGDGMAPEVTYNGHRRGGEISAIPNDVVTLPDGKQVMSLQSVRTWLPGTWRTNYSELALSRNGGNSFERTGVRWGNPDGTSSSQMVSMQLDGEYIYMIGVRAGRVDGPLRLTRVAWRDVFDPAAYRCWNGTAWATRCGGLFDGRFGEPSLRKLRDGTWVMAYLNAAKRAIVTRWALDPAGPWSQEAIQFPDRLLGSMYGGFIHPYSTRDRLTLMVSSWQRDHNGTTKRYDVSQVTGLTIRGMPATGNE